MSDPVAALGGAVAAHLVEVREEAPMGMVTLRAEISARDVAAALKPVLGTSVPKARKMVEGTHGKVLWMAPDELLCFAPYHEAQGLADAISAALGDTHHLAVVVSDARSVFRLSGDAADQVVAKLAPVDMKALAADEVRRTRFAQIPAALWRVEGGLQIVCFRSMARYAFDLLAKAAQ